MGLTKIDIKDDGTDKITIVYHSDNQADITVNMNIALAKWVRDELKKHIENLEMENR